MFAIHQIKFRIKFYKQTKKVKKGFVGFVVPIYNTSSPFHKITGKFGKASHEIHIHVHRTHIHTHTRVKQ